jgi:hypothetical protein
MRYLFSVPHAVVLTDNIWDNMEEGCECASSITRRSMWVVNQGGAAKLSSVHTHTRMVLNPTLSNMI